MHISNTLIQGSMAVTACIFFIQAYDVHAEVFNISHFENSTHIMSSLSQKVLDNEVVSNVKKVVDQVDVDEKMGKIMHTVLASIQNMGNSVSRTLYIDNSGLHQINSMEKETQYAALNYSEGNNSAFAQNIEVGETVLNPNLTQVQDDSHQLAYNGVYQTERLSDHVSRMLFIISTLFFLGGLVLVSGVHETFVQRARYVGSSVKRQQLFYEPNE